MAMYSQFSLQKAIYDRLYGDTTLASMVTGVYDHPPPSSKLPYLTFVSFSASDWSSVTTQGVAYQIELHSFSRQGGQKEAASILKQVQWLLHDVSLTLPSPEKLVMIRFVSGQVILEADGQTFRGVVRFKALVQTN